VLVYMLMHDEPVTKRDAARAVSLIVSTVGTLFYCGFFYAAITRDVALRACLSAPLRRIPSDPW